jgi:hypothetical protein
LTQACSLVSEGDYFFSDSMSAECPIVICGLYLCYIYNIKTNRDDGTSYKSGVL